MKLFLEIVTTAGFPIFKLRLFITKVTFLFQISNAKVLDDPITEHNFFHVKILELFDLKVVLFLDFGKNRRFIEVKEIFRYPFS